jgi:hypothetical protein
MAQTIPTFIQHRGLPAGQVVYMPSPQIVPLNQYFINYYNQPGDLSLH